MAAVRTREVVTSLPPQNLCGNRSSKSIQLFKNVIVKYKNNNVAALLSLHFAFGLMIRIWTILEPGVSYVFISIINIPKDCTDNYSCGYGDSFEFVSYKI